MSDFSEIVHSGGAKRYLLDIFFPNRCPFCGKFISYDLLCCEECFNNALWADENICGKCGKSVLKGCMCSSELNYDACVTAMYFQGIGKNCIHNLKFKGNINGGELMGRIIHERLIAMGFYNEIDAIVPVPMAAKQRSVRGYNQAELIAKAIASKSDIPVINNVLIRKNVKVSQHMLGAQERHNAVSEQYFAADEKSLEGMTILLVDDVLTTGSTLGYCAYLLKDRLHAARVICAAAATV